MDGVIHLAKKKKKKKKVRFSCRTTTNNYEQQLLLLLTVQTYHTVYMIYTPRFSIGIYYNRPIFPYVLFRPLLLFLEIKLISF